MMQTGYCGLANLGMWGSCYAHNQEKQSINVAKLKHQQEQQAKDQQGIDKITSTLSGSTLNQKEILNKVTPLGLGERACKKILGKYSDQQTELPVFWITKRGVGKEILYEVKSVN